MSIVTDLLLENQPKRALVFAPRKSTDLLPLNRKEMSLIRQVILIRIGVFISGCWNFTESSFQDIEIEEFLLWVF